MQEHWSVDGSGWDDYVKDSAVEFRYDSLRGRYLKRALDPNHGYAPTESGLWTDYLGDPPYGDFGLNGQAEPVEQVRYFGGLAQQAVGGDSRYFHGDLVGSTSLTTDEAGDPAAKLAYTAFGEPIGEAPEGFPRYQYAGAHGYESGLVVLEGGPGSQPIALQHVGARWY